MLTFREKFDAIVAAKNSLLCIGLDVAKEKIPEMLRYADDPAFEFNKRIIDATCDLTLAYKLNTAFYEAAGLAGWQALRSTVEYLPEDTIVIADAKRGDIGNTSQMYAQAFFQELNFDAITVNPLMGLDSVQPFIQFENKGAFILCLTSNAGARDLQYFSDGHETLYQKIARTVVQWNDRGNCGLVVGATRPEELAAIREIAPGLIFLIPGLGAQGGDLEASVWAGTDARASAALFNSSRGIIYQSSANDFAVAARAAAMQLCDQLNQVRLSKRIEKK